MWGRGTNGGRAGGKGNGAAFNEVEGGGGNDTITGNGNTRVAYYHATGGVVVTLGANGSGTADGNVSVGHDTITGGVNAVTGSGFHHILFRNCGHQTFDWPGRHHGPVRKGRKYTPTSRNPKRHLLFPC